jgi:hypothetical protein
MTMLHDELRDLAEQIDALLTFCLGLWGEDTRTFHQTDEEGAHDADLVPAARVRNPDTGSVTIRTYPGVDLWRI